jgi:uncharacterized protein YidB (DUF937 family)
MGLIHVIRRIRGSTRGEFQRANGPVSPLSPPPDRAMPPIAIALLGLIAYNALRSRDGLGSSFPPAENASTRLRHVLDALIGRRAAGVPGSGSRGVQDGAVGGPELVAGLLCEGIRHLIEGFEESGHKEVVQSWVDKGSNQQIAPYDLESALGNDTLDALRRETGLGRGEMLDGLTSYLPEFIDRLTPEGRLPTQEEVSQYPTPIGSQRDRQVPWLNAKPNRPNARNDRATAGSPVDW